MPLMLAIMLLVITLTGKQANIVCNGTLDLMVKNKQE